MSATNGIAKKDKTAALKRRLEEARLEARAIIAERQLRQLRESAALDFDWVTPWKLALEQRGESGWLPIGSNSARRYGINFPFYQNESEHAFIRDLSRIVVGTNNHAWGMLRGLRSFVIGTGMEFKVSGRLADRKAGAAAAKRITDWLDLWAKKTRWYERQRELFWRNHRDGDALLRTFPDDGWMKLRYAWPEQMTQPPESRFEEWGFGVQADPEDAETILGYHFAEITRPGQLGEIVEVPWTVLHLKANVDAGIKRGLPDFSFGTKDVLDVSGRLTRNIGEGAAARAAIAWVRQHAGSEEEEVQEFIASTRSYQERMPFNDKLRDVTHIPPAAALDISDGMEFVGMPVDPGTEGHISAQAMLLRSAGTRWNAPEWLIAGDASNNNFASSLVAESPFVRSIQEAQDYYKTRFLEVVDAALVCAVAHGVIDAADVDAVTVDLVPPTPAVRNKLEEAQRAAIEIPLGTDSPQNYCSAQGRDYDEIIRENQEHIDRFGSPGATLPIPGELVPGAHVRTQGGNGDDSGGDQSQLRGTVGGLQAIKDMQAAFYNGDIPHAAAVAAMQILFRFSPEEAGKLFPDVKPIDRTDDAGQTKPVPNPEAK